MNNIRDDPPSNEAVIKFQKQLKKYKHVMFMEQNKRRTRASVKAQSSQSFKGTQ